MNGYISLDIEGVNSYNARHLAHQGYTAAAATALIPPPPLPYRAVGPNNIIARLWISFLNISGPLTHTHTHKIPTNPAERCVPFARHKTEREINHLWSLSRPRGDGLEIYNINSHYCVIIIRFSSFFYIESDKYQSWWKINIIPAVASSFQ